MILEQVHHHHRVEHFEFLLDFLQEEKQSTLGENFDLDWQYTSVWAVLQDKPISRWEKALNWCLYSKLYSITTSQLQYKLSIIPSKLWSKHSTRSAQLVIFCSWMHRALRDRERAYNNRVTGSIYILSRDSDSDVDASTVEELELATSRYAIWAISNTAHTHPPCANIALY